MEIEKARQLIVEENKKRAQACQEEIQKVCEKHDCVLNAVPVLAQRGDGFVIVCELRITTR